MLKKSKFFMVGLASAMLATSCSGDDSLGTLGTSESNMIKMAASVEHKTKAVETTTANLKEFYAYSFQAGQANYMNKVKYALSGSAWGTDAGSFYWPVTGDLNFYCYAPETPGAAGTFTINKDKQTLADFVPQTAAASQKDFIYAKATGNKNNTGGTVNVNFSHALTEILVKAKNSNTAYTIQVTGVRLGNVKNKGTFAFPSTSGTAASWTLSSVAGDKQNYETTWTTDATIGSDASNFNAANVPFMLIPQQLAKATKAADGNYIALKVKIKMAGGQYLCGTAAEGQWVYIPVDTKWEMGKSYVYTLDFSNGAGQDENGNAVISGTGIVMNVTVGNWTSQGEAVSVK